MDDVVVAVVVFVLRRRYWFSVASRTPAHHCQQPRAPNPETQQNVFAISSRIANFAVDLRATCNLEAAESYRCRRPRKTRQPCTRRHNGPRLRRHVRCEFVLHNAKNVWDATARLYGRRERTSVAQESFRPRIFVTRTSTSKRSTRGSVKCVIVLRPYDPSRQRHPLSRNVILLPPSTC